MKVHDIGMNFRHSSVFFINRPNGSGDNLLLIFKTPARIKLAEEIKIIPADTAIIYKKGTEQSYGAYGDTYINHWLHFEADETDEIYKKLNLTFNVPIYLKNHEVCEKVMSDIHNEALSQNPNCEISIDILLRLLAARIAENLTSSGETGLPRDNIHSAALRRLRADIYDNPARTVTIRSLAASLGLSPSYFQSVYRTQFGVSCYDDVLNARIRAAKYYLRSTHLSVKEISLLCGCENPEHFMRQFRLRTGQTPTEYRKSTAIL